jgi:hypothetical protein
VSPGARRRRRAGKPACWIAFARRRVGSLGFVRVETEPEGLCWRESVEGRAAWELVEGRCIEIFDSEEKELAELLLLSDGRMSQWRY